jgi:hypothetical protein
MLGWCLCHFMNLAGNPRVETEQWAYWPDRNSRPWPWAQILQWLAGLAKPKIPVWDGSDGTHTSRKSLTFPLSEQTGNSDSRRMSGARGPSETETEQEEQGPRRTSGTYASSSAGARCTRTQLCTLLVQLLLPRLVHVVGQQT